MTRRRIVTGVGSPSLHHVAGTLAAAGVPLAATAEEVLADIEAGRADGRLTVQQARDDLRAWCDHVGGPDWKMRALGSFSLPVVRPGVGSRSLLSDAELRAVAKRIRRRARNRRVEL